MSSTASARKPRLTKARSLRLLTCLGVVTCLPCGYDTEPASAQVRGPRIIRRGNVASPDRYAAADNQRVLIEPSAPIANLFARADDGVARSDWKFTIDCLQRVLESGDPSLVPEESGGVDGEMLFRSVRRRALERLASLPAPALASYRLLYDGRAKRLFELGAATHDADQLRRVVDRYLLTSYGDDAVDRLVSWLLDAGQIDEAVRLLNELSELVPDRDRFSGRTAAQLVAALTLQGNGDEVVILLDRIAAASSSETPAVALARAAAGLSQPVRVDPGESDPWPMVGGNLRRVGRMVAVEPTFLEPIPWRCELPGSSIDAWRSVYTNDPAAAIVLPVGQPVTDGESIFVRTRYGSLAMDPENLSQRWLVEEEEAKPQTVVRRSGTRGGQLPARVHAPRALSPMFEDYATGAIGVAHGLVMNISRDGSGGAYELSDRDTGGQWRLIPRLPRRGNVANALRGSRLIAYDARTGEMRWQRGRTADPDDPFGEVEFRSLPVPVGDTLWVLFCRQNDYFAGELDPRDGALLRRVLLGSFRDEPFRPSNTLPPAVADDVVYIPTGEGVLFALDATTGTLRWASQFMCTSDTVDPSQTRWLPTPPMLTRGLVLLAPIEHDALMAFSMETGDIRWTVPRGNLAYVVAADAEHVWVGGRDIVCLDLRDGSTVWRHSLPSGPTGRAVLSGDILYAPVLDGLVSLHAPSGATVDHQPLPTADEPLGNILSFGKAMFVSTPTTVRKFPDLRRIYPETLAEHAADPEDVVVAVRLAWLELLRNEPERAQVVLARLPDSSEISDPITADDIAHVRVETLLRLARGATAAGRPASVTLEHLEAAVAMARSVSDKWRCGKAMAEHFTVMGRWSDAYEYLWRLGIGRDAEHIGALGDYVSGRARVEVAARLAEIAGELNAEQTNAVTTAASRELAISLQALKDPTGAREAERRLRAMAEIERPATVAREARLALANHYQGSGQFEQAEQVLREAVRAAATPEAAIVPLMRLCQVYEAALSVGVASAEALEATLEELTSRFPTARVPDALGPQAGSSPRSLADWAISMRMARGLTARRKTGAVDLTRPFSFTGDLAWSREWDPREQPGAEGVPPRLVDFGMDPPPVLADRVILQAGNDLIYCLNACDGEALWRTELRLPGAFPDRDLRSAADSGSVTRLAALDGQTAIFSGMEGLFAVGVVTGRRLWVRPYETGDVSHIPLNGDWLLAADRGAVAAMPRVGRLTLMRTLDGGTIWERDLRGEPVGRIMMVGDRVVTIDEAQQRVHIFDREDGQLINRAVFRQPDPAGLALNLVVTGGVVCGPVYTQEFQGVSATSLATGERLWRVSASQPIGQVFVPKEGYVGVSLLGGEVRILEAETGEIAINRTLAQAHMITDGAMVDGTLLLQYMPSANRPDMQRFAAMDVATGDEMWRADDHAPLTTTQLARHVRAGRLPVAVVGSARSGMKRDELHITMLDVDTGESVGMTAVVTEYEHALMAQSGVQMLPAGGVGLVNTGSSVRAYHLVQQGAGQQQGL